MKIKYAVYDAITGENTLYDSKEQALEAFWAYVVALAKSHFNNSAYTVVEQYEDGTEKWFNDNNQEIEVEIFDKTDYILAGGPLRTTVEVLP
jgi:hypothetical protein